MPIRSSPTIASLRAEGGLILKQKVYNFASKATGDVFHNCPAVRSNATIWKICFYFEFENVVFLLFSFHVVEE